ncbi:MAG: ATP-binding protein [Bacteroidales bacterium]
MKDKKDVAGKVVKGPTIVTFYTPDTIFDAVLNNEPIQDPASVKCQDVFELLERLYMLSCDRESGRISTKELLSVSRDLISNYQDFPLVKQVMEMNLSDGDIYLLCNLLWKHITGVSFVDVESAVNGIFDVMRQRFEQKQELLLNQHPLIRNNLIELEKSKIFSNTWIKVQDKAMALLISDGSKIALSKGKNENIISPMEITRKELIFNQQESSQINQLIHSLQEVKFLEIQQRMKEKGLPTGFTVLLWGLPGTGKTESVYQLARETGREIMCVDLSQSKSMWFGESEKIVKKIFSDYTLYVKKCKIIPILLFNEADGIFSKRTDLVNSNVGQTENTIQNIILQELETFSGILIATTNLASNFDKAFERRFLYKIGLSKPDLASRSQIWKVKLPGISGPDCTVLGEKFDFSGGQIDNIVRKYEIVSVLEGRTPNLPELITFCNEELLDKSTYTKIGYSTSKS